MKKAGGIVALIAGVFGVVAAGITLFVGGLGGAFDAEGASTVIGLGWGGVLFSFLTIAMGAVTINAKTKKPVVILMVFAIAGAILGGTVVAIFMGLAFIGGVIAIFDKKSSSTTEES